MTFDCQLITRSIGPRLWVLHTPLRYTDDAGCPWVIPAGFATDKRTTRILLPSVGFADAAWVTHDFERLVRKLVGLSATDIDLRRFYSTLRAVEYSRTWARAQTLAVRTAYLCGFRSEGKGWHGAPDSPTRYDLPVIDDVTGETMNMAKWVCRYYAPDGNGWQTPVGNGNEN